MPRSSEATPALHSAGATVLHRSPFEDLEVPVSSDPIDPELRDRWVKPLYMAVPDKLDSIETVFRSLQAEVTPALISALLAQFNWRPRSVGAFLIALDRRGDFEDLVGRLLLRSDVCFAGRAYCIALARLNTRASVDFVRRYLRYYLTRQDLWFDQADALAALTYLDELNGTAHAREFDEPWREFVSNKPHWDLERTSLRFKSTVYGLATFHAKL